MRLPVPPFCPDHRDKVAGLSCRQCMIESLVKTVERVIDTLDPEMPSWDIVELREYLIRKLPEITR